jgi:hypothetical protein
LAAARPFGPAFFAEADPRFGCFLSTGPLSLDSSEDPMIFVVGKIKVKKCRRQNALYSDKKFPAYN